MRGLDLTTIMFVALFFKHFVVDFLLQYPYQYLNKGKYGHPGGILHAGLHIIGSFLALTPWLFVWGFFFMSPDWYYGVKVWGWILLAEGVIHYHIDWAKVNICKVMEWRCNTSEKFWSLLGLDQFLHYMTYAGMIVALSYWG